MLLIDLNQLSIFYDSNAHAARELLNKYFPVFETLPGLFILFHIFFAKAFYIYRWYWFHFHFKRCMYTSRFSKTFILILNSFIYIFLQRDDCWCTMLLLLCVCSFLHQTQYFCYFSTSLFAELKPLDLHIFFLCFCCC